MYYMYAHDAGILDCVMVGILELGRPGLIPQKFFLD